MRTEWGHALKKFRFWGLAGAESQLSQCLPPTRFVIGLVLACWFATAPVAEAGAISVTDAAGRRLAFARAPQRIVVIGMAPHIALHLLYAFPEGRRRLVGMESKGRSPSDFLPLVDPAFNRVSVLKTNPGAEEIAALKPDLVIMKGMTLNKVGESLSSLGIPCLYISMETPDRFLKELATIGAVLESPRRAAEIAAFYEDRLARLHTAVGGLKESQKPRVLLVEYSDRGGRTAVQVPGDSWMQTIEVKAAGGNPVWLEASQGSEGWTIVNFEQIARWNPDQVFVVVWYTLDPKIVIGSLKADPKWAALKAVRKNQLYAFPCDIFGWDSPELRWILGMDWLAAKIHPQRFKNVDMKREIVEFFGRLYGMTPAAVHTGIMPRVQLDVR